MPDKVRGVVFCSICDRDVHGSLATDPRGKKNEVNDTAEIMSLLAADHRAGSGHFPDGVFRLVEVPETEAQKAFIPSGKVPQWKKSRSSPSDGSGTHSGPSHDRRPHLVVVGSPENEDEQRRREQASMRDPSPHRRAARAK